jgi:hypothetical protein
MVSKKKNSNPNDIELMPLKSINNNYELDIIKSILDDNNIPYITHVNQSPSFIFLYSEINILAVSKSNFSFIANLFTKEIYGSLELSSLIFIF